MLFSTAGGRPDPLDAVKRIGHSDAELVGEDPAEATAAAQCGRHHLRFVKKHNPPPDVQPTISRLPLRACRPIKATTDRRPIRGTPCGVLRPRPGALPSGRT